MTNDVTQPAATPSAEFRVGAVISRSFAVFFRNFIPFLVLAIIFTFPAHILEFFPGLLTVDNYMGLAGLNTIISLLGMSLLSATIVYGTILQLRGGHASMLHCVVKGLGLMLPVIAVSLLVGIIVALGFMFFVIPGIILYVVLWVAVPAAVVERPGIVASLGRSASLTKGYRWRVFAVVLVFIIISIVATLLFGLPTAAVVTQGGTETFTLAKFTLFVVQAIVAALSSVAIAVGYHDLRIAKEGVDSDRIAAVFD